MLSQTAITPTTAPLHIEQFTGLDEQTVQRLHSLGLTVGSTLVPVRFYPFHGPVIINVNQQQIGIRYAVFQTLIGGN